MAGCQGAPRPGRVVTGAQGLVWGRPLRFPPFIFFSSGTGPSSAHRAPQRVSSRPRSAGTVASSDIQQEQTKTRGWRWSDYIDFGISPMSEPGAQRPWLRVPSRGLQLAWYRQSGCHRHFAGPDSFNINIYLNYKTPSPATYSTARLQLSGMMVTALVNRGLVWA